MPSYQLRALVLRKTKLGEADIILNLLAADGRIVRAVAKGMRKPTSRFSGRLEPGSVADLMLNTGRNLEIVSDARSVDLHAALRTDYDRSCIASVVLDVLDKLAVEGQAEERLFGLACATLDALSTASAEAGRAVLTAFLVKAMAMHGYRPHLDSCVLCGCEPGAVTRFSLESGGVTCPSCCEEGHGSTRLSQAGCEALRTLLRSTMADVAATPPPARVLSECFDIMRDFLTCHVPVRIKALDFYSGQAER